MVFNIIFKVELVMALEEEFEKEIPDEDADKIQTVQDAIHHIKNHIEVILPRKNEPTVELQ